MAAYCRVYGVIHCTSLAGKLPVHQNQLRVQRSVTSMERLYLFIQYASMKQNKQNAMHSKSDRRDSKAVHAHSSETTKNLRDHSTHEMQFFYLFKIKTAQIIFS